MKSQNLPADVWEIYRHWSPRSEAYTGCDTLISAMDNGWELRRLTAIHRHVHGTRYSLSFGLLMQNGSQLAEMRVIDNPTLRHFLKNMGLLPLHRPETILETQELVTVTAEQPESVLAR